nr:GNAT family N-acetyltransferase [Pseudomonas sp. Fl4BN1]
MWQYPGEPAREGAPEVQLFETPRLIGRPLSRDDLPVLSAILSDPQVMKHSLRGVCDQQATLQFIDWCLACYAEHGMGPWALVEKVSGELVGFCGVGPEQLDGVQEANLGYRLARRFWNQGLASQAVRGVLGLVFGQRHLASVVVIIEPAHGASLRVAEKAGFCEYQVMQFHQRPVRLYRMTGQQWQALCLDQ